MARASKPVSMQSAHLTKEEKEKRQQAEDKLKGNDNLVYKAPKHFSKDGKKIYKNLVNELRSSAILNNLDITILETCVDSILRMNECRELIDKLGSVIIDSDTGSITRNPATVVYKDYNAIFNKCCMELGLSPSSRAKLASINVQANADKEDPLLNILAKKRERNGQP